MIVLRVFGLAKAAFGCCLGLAVFPATAQSLPVERGNYVVGIWGETNSFRKSAGTERVIMNNKLHPVAQRYAEILAQQDARGHTADGRTPRQRLEAAGLTKCRAVRENVYSHWTKPNRASWGTVVNAAMDSWKNSPGHRANLLASDVDAIGVGSAAWTHNGVHTYKVVQIFTDGCGGAIELPAPGNRKIGRPSKAIAR